METRFWTQNSRADFDKGTLRGVSLRSDGRLALAPVLRELHDPSAPYLWALAEDSKGNLYAGGGSGANGTRLYVVPPNGPGRIAAEVEGLEIHAITVGRGDEVFFATSPDSKVYRLAPGGKATPFYDPRSKYVWAMAFNSKGDLFVATGDAGEVHRVTPDGRGAVFFRTEETHARSLAIDSADNLIVGTEPGGLVLRVSPAGQGFVLHQMGKREVTAVGLAPDGTVYAAAVGNKPVPAPATPPAAISVAPAPAPAGTPPPPATAGQRPAVAAPASLVVGGPTVVGGSEVVRIDKEGAPRRVWSDGQEIVYALSIDPQGRPLLGTGNQGRIVRIDSDLLSTRLVDTTTTQVTALQMGRDGRIYVATGNIGKVYQVGPGLEASGTYESDAFDAGSFTYWGRLVSKDVPGPGRVTYETRSGNLDRPTRNWSPWAALGEGGRVASPAARFLQVKATLSAGNGPQAPQVVQVETAYLPKNVAPLVTQVEVTPANYRFPAASPVGVTSTSTLSLPPLGQPRRAPVTPAPLEASGSLSYAKGFTGVRWAASDENGDDLTFTVELRGLQETAYRVLQDKVRQRQVSIDTAALPDGQYVVRVTATDRPGNPPAQALAASLESDPFTVDNTAPVVTGLAGTTSGSSLTIRWRARDARSILTSAEYSHNGSEWFPVQPVTRLSDAAELEYALTLPRNGTAEQVVAVRVTDEYDNQTVEKVVVQ